MRSYIKHTILRLMLVAALALAVAPGAYAQPPPRDPGQGEDPVGQPAPIGGGLALLIAFGAAYGFVKMKKRPSGRSGSDMR